MTTEWEIQSRGTQCSVTGRKFKDGETFYTLLFRERGGTFRREDLCEEAWAKRDPTQKPFSFWRVKFELPPPPPAEPLPKQTAEDLLRRYMSEPGKEHANVRYILALMLERKRTLKPIESKEENGEQFIIYERVKTGEVFIILDPQLQLDQLEAVQAEVAALLG